MNVGKTRICVEKGGMRCVRALYKQSVTLEKVRLNADGEVKFTVKASDKAKTFAILKNLCYNYSVEWDAAISSLIKAFSGRLGILLGAVICAAAFLLCSRCVFFVKAECVQGADADSVRRAVSEYVRLPSFASDVNVREIEKRVLSLDGIGSCVAFLRGNVIVVRATGAVNSSEQQQKTEIISRSDAVITRITVRKGSALKKVGDVVKRGEVVISGDVYASDGITVIEKVLPDGEVRGKTSYALSTVIPPKKVEKAYTGRVKNIAFLTLYGRNVSVKSPFSLFDESVERRQTGIFIPLEYVEIRRREFVFVEKPSDLAAEEKKLYSALEQGVFGKILERKTVTDDLGGGVKKITVCVVAESVIAD